MTNRGSPIKKKLCSSYLQQEHRYEAVNVDGGEAGAAAARFPLSCLPLNLQKIPIATIPINVNSLTT